MFQDLALYYGAFYNRCANFNLTVVVCEQDLVETYGRIYLALKTVNIKFPTFLSFELLTCNFYYNVHLTKIVCAEAHFWSANIDLIFGSDKYLSNFFPEICFGTVLGDAAQHRKCLKTDLMKPRILLLSDHDLRAELVRASLIGLDVELHEAADAWQFERLTARMSYELVILLGVGRLLGGAGWIERLRPQGLHRPQLFVVAWQASEQMVLSLLEGGVDQYMTFPINPIRLRAKVIGVLQAEVVEGWMR